MANSRLRQRFSRQSTVVRSFESPRLDHELIHLQEQIREKNEALEETDPGPAASLEDRIEHSNEASRLEGATGVLKALALARDYDKQLTK